MLMGIKKGHKKDSWTMLKEKNSKTEPSMEINIKALFWSGYIQVYKGRPLSKCKHLLHKSYWDYQININRYDKRFGTNNLLPFC